MSIRLEVLPQYRDTSPEPSKVSFLDLEAEIGIDIAAVFQKAMRGSSLHPNN